MNICVKTCYFYSFDDPVRFTKYVIIYDIVRMVNMSDSHFYHCKRRMSTRVFAYI